MSHKERDKRFNVTVQGRLTGQMDEEGNEHQTYRYHINIDQEDNNRKREYDNEIHIFKSVTHEATPVSPANRQEYLETPVAEPTAPATEPEQAVHRATVNDTAPAQANSAQHLIRKISSLKWPTLNFSFKKFRRPVINLTLPSIPTIDFKKALQNFRREKKPQQPDADKISQTNTNNSLTGRLKAVFLVKPTRKSMLRFCLPCILLTLAALLIYYLHSIKPAEEKPVYPVNKTEHHNKDITNIDYHAVIEKTSRGVVITLQGPDHEEILTKLPPGYDPILEGNKIVHVVTPGNTLWFIAMRYIKNPYRYPELARLNGIKNPDLIYPGEKVIIQYIKKP